MLSELKMFKIIAALALCLVVCQASDGLNAAKQYALEIEAAAKDDIHGVLDSFQAQLDEINKKAKDPGTDITKRIVKESYHQLLQVMGTAITEANTTCNDALNAAKIEAATKDEIQGVLDSFQAQLDEINKKAKDAGIDITECRKYEVQFSQLPDTYMDQIVACINNQIINDQNQINDTMNRPWLFSKIFFSTIDKQIDDCGSGWNSIACLAKLVIKIAEDFDEGPSKINTDVDNTVEIIKNAWPEIKQCATSATENIPSEAGKIVKEFTVCAAIP